MIIGVLTLELDIPGAMSLKDKRAVLNRLKDRVHNTFNVSCAEVGANDVWNYAIIGIAVVSNQQTHANQVLCKVLDLIEQKVHDCGVDDVDMEFIHAG